MNKRLFVKIFIPLIIICVFSLLFVKWFHHSSYITIHYVDKNGASISYDRVVKSKTGLIFTSHKYFKKISGYRIVSNKFGLHMFPVHTSEISIRYTPMSENKEINKIKNSKYLGVTFQPMTVKPKDGTQLDPFPLSRTYSGETGRDTLRIVYSNNGLFWKKAKINYPVENIRDPSIKKIGHNYYIIYTHGILKTDDFKNWDILSWKYSKRFSNEWAPEFVKTKNNKYYVIMAASQKGSNKFHLYYSSFNKQNGEIKNNWKLIEGNDFPNNMIDGHIDFKNGHYYLWYKDENTKTLNVATSIYFNKGYKIMNNNIPKSFDGVEGPETLWINSNRIILYFDTYDLPEAKFHGIHYTESSDGGKHWTNVKKIRSDFIVRHFEPIQNK